MPIKFRAQANGDLEIELYDVVGFWGTTPKDFAQRLKNAKGKNVMLRINSPGGSIIDGTAIYNLLKAHSGKVTAHIDGIAASMAGVIAMAASHIVMPDNTFIMIHNPSTLMEGESEDLRKAADIMDKMKENLISAYEAKSGQDRETIAQWMDEESWFTAAECLNLGLCDEVVESVAAAAFLKASDYFPSRFINAGDIIPPIKSNGGQKNHPPTNTMNEMEQKAHTDALNRVAVLEQQAKDAASAHAKALTDVNTTALQEATTAAKTAETKRKGEILALQKKYDKDGDLAQVTIDAIAGETTAEEFKDLVLDVVNARPSKSALKPAEATASGDDRDVEESKFLAAYKAAKTPRERLALTRTNKAIARRLAKELV